MTASGEQAMVGSAPWADRLGIWASAACVVHCLFTPVLVGMSAVLAHVLPGEAHTHRVLAVLVALFGAVALIQGFRRHHRRTVVAMFCGGVGLIAGAAVFGDRLPSPHWELAVTVAGSALMIGAHRLNHTFCRGCVCATPAAPAD